MTDAVRVLQVVHGMNQGGVENFLMNVYRKTDKKKIQFDFIYHTGEKCFFDDEITASGGKIYRCPDYRIINHLEYIAWWKDFLKKHTDYKIIHSHLDSCANIHLRVAKKFGLVTIAHAHSTSDGKGYKANVKRILKIGFNGCCDYKFACSKAAARWLYGKETEENGKCEIILNGIDAEKFKFNEEIRQKIRSELLLENKLAIGHVGSFYPVKNHEFLLKCFWEILKINSNACLLLIGEGPTKERIIALAKELDIYDKVKFLGLKSNVNDYMQAMDVFVLPSLYEGLPVTLIEAQAAGLPCMVSDSVTTEVSVTENCVFKSLKNDLSQWAWEIVRVSKETVRTVTTQQIIDSGYDIANTAEKLTRFYLDHWKTASV